MPLERTKDPGACSSFNGHRFNETTFVDRSKYRDGLSMFVSLVSVGTLPFFGTSVWALLTATKTRFIKEHDSTHTFSSECLLGLFEGAPQLTNASRGLLLRTIRPFFRVRFALFRAPLMAPIPTRCPASSC